MRNTFLLALLALLLLWLVLHHEHTERDNTEVLEVKKKSSLISTSSSKEKREHTIVCIKEIILLRGSRFLLIGISSRDSQRALESIPILSLFFHNLLVLLICVASFSLFLFLLLQFLHMKRIEKANTSLNCFSKPGTKLTSLSPKEWQQTTTSYPLHHSHWWAGSSLH